MTGREACPTQRAKKLRVASSDCFRPDRLDLQDRESLEILHENIGMDLKIRRVSGESQGGHDLGSPRHHQQFVEFRTETQDCPSTRRVANDAKRTGRGILKVKVNLDLLPRRCDIDDLFGVQDNPGRAGITLAPEERAGDAADGKQEDAAKQKYLAHE